MNTIAAQSLSYKTLVLQDRDLAAPSPVIKNAKISRSTNRVVVQLLLLLLQQDRNLASLPLLLAIPVAFAPSPPFIFYFYSFGVKTSKGSKFFLMPQGKLFRMSSSRHLISYLQLLNGADRMRFPSRIGF